MRNLKNARVTHMGAKAKKVLDLVAKRKRRNRAEEWPARYSKLMREAIEALGGPEEACKILGRRGRPPLDVAIALLGGQIATADKLGINRQRFYRMVQAGTKKWDGEFLERLAELSGVSIAMLMRTAEEAGNVGNLNGAQQ
jgi:hypothetical protein